MWEFIAATLPHVNASLNAIATVLLCTGFVLIKQKRIDLHRRVMVTCFAVSCLFLACYLTHKFALYQTTGKANKAFSTAAELANVRRVYLGILVTHLIGAILVPPLAITSIVLGWKDRREAHRRVSRWTFPIWLYVSVTGVVVYFMLYQWYV
jgi:putative membrane protein